VTSEPFADPRTVLDTVRIRSGTLEVTCREVLWWSERFDPLHAARRQRRAALGTLDDDLLAADIEDAAVEFRFARELEAEAALTAWLAARGLSVAGWWEALRRNYLEAHFTGVPLLGADQSAAGDDDPEQDVWLADLVLSNLLTAPTEALLRRIAVARKSAGWLPPPPGAGLETWHQSLEQPWQSWRQPLLSEPRLRETLERSRLSLLLVVTAESHWPNRDAAQEAMAGVQYDGSDLLAVARSAGVPSLETTRLLSEAPPVLRDGLLAAGAGELIDPMERTPFWILAQLRTKLMPTLEQPLVRAAVEAELEAQAIRSLVFRHITFPPLDR
jgi:hypothetical protein